MSRKNEEVGKAFLIGSGVVLLVGLSDPCWLPIARFKSGEAPHLFLPSRITYRPSA
jgi:hypothetical protein